MRRCLQLAALCAGITAPNPMVGAVLVYNHQIIGEGYTQPYGGPHAEVMCINSVSAEQQLLIPEAVLYVSLEPCAHHGKTPPCADLIIAKQIKTVVIGCSDPFTAVNGKGIEKLRAAGITVIEKVLEADCLYSNRRFITMHTKQRPYIILKWAQSADGFIAAKNKQVAISNELTNRLVHRWRTEEAAIMVGRRTAVIDNPQLTARLWPGNNPVRIIVGQQTSLPEKVHLLDGSVPTHFFYTQKEELSENIQYHQLQSTPLVPKLLQRLYELRLNSVLIEGGAALINEFVKAGIWDEARVITNHSLTLKNGVAAPVLQEQQWVSKEQSATDTIDYFTNLSNN